MFHNDLLSLSMNVDDKKRFWFSLCCQFCFTSCLSSSPQTAAHFLLWRLYRMYFSLVFMCDSVFVCLCNFTICQGKKIFSSLIFDIIFQVTPPYFKNQIYIPINQTVRCFILIFNDLL